jgi:hypothetical protein
MPAMKYTLQPYTTPSSRYHCPQCNDRGRTFVRYIDTETGEHLADHVGRCGRENSCGYHYKPGQYFEANRVHRPPPAKKTYHPKHKTYNTQAPNNYINPDIVNATLTKYERNNFVQYLLDAFDFDVVYQLICRYRIGTARYWKGSTVFWQIDTEGFVRTGKVMLYDTKTGKRVKKPFNHITWVHTLLAGESSMVSSESAVVSGTSGNTHNSPVTIHNFKLRQCLFGEHLLKEFPDKPVAIVESEKTAIIASAYNDSFVWLAAGSVNNLNTEICKPLRGRTVILYPDLGAYDKWTAKARHLQSHLKGSVFAVSRLLENIASADQRQQGYDLGDLLKN